VTGGLAGLCARGVASGDDVTELPGAETERGDRNVLTLGDEIVWETSRSTGVNEVSFLGENDRFGVWVELFDFAGSLTFDHPGLSLPFII